MTSILTKKESSVVDMHSLDYYLEILSEYNQAVFSIQAQIDLYVALKKMIFDPAHPAIQSNLLNTNILDLHIAYDLYTLGCLYFENTYYQESHGKEQHRWIAYSLFSLLEVFYQTANRTDHFVAKMVTKKISELVSSAEERKPSRRSPICTLFKKETLDTETYPFNSHVSPNFF